MEIDSGIYKEDNEENAQTNIEVNKKENKEIFCLWLKKDTKSANLYGIFKLHCEILDFYQFIKLTEEEKRQRTNDIINEIIIKNFPNFFYILLKFVESFDSFDVSFFSILCIFLYY